MFHLRMLPVPDKPVFALVAKEKSCTKTVSAVKIKRSNSFKKSINGEIYRIA
jgi:hypothetical protein